MKRFPMEAGRVVRSRAGRDEGRHMVIVAIEDDEFVRVADGDLRKLAGPKRKKIKHLHATPAAFPELIARIAAGEPVQDAEIRKALQLAGYGKTDIESSGEGVADGKE